MDKNKNIPEIRFESFIDTWDQRKLGDMGSTFTGLSGKTKDDFGHGDAKFITYTNVFSNPVTDLLMTEAVEIDSKQNSVKAGDVFFTTSSETPEEVGMSSVMPKNIDNIYLNSFCFGYRPNEKFDLYYLAYVLRSRSFRREMKFLAQGISRYNISKNKVMEVEIPVPSLNEQNKLGHYFSNLDRIITLHYLKYEKLKDLKKSMLYKLFPKEGESVPEIRFDGFSGEWEKISILNLLEERNTQLPKDEEYPLKAFVAYEGIVDKGNRYDRSSLIKDEDNKKYKRTEFGDFIYSSNNLTTGSIGLNKFGKASISPVYSIFSTRCGVDPNFIGVVLTKKEFINKMIRTRQGVVYGQWRIHEKDFLDLCIFAPDYKEQKVIGEYFSELDKLIELNREKLEKLKNIKSTLLDKMFV